MEKKITINGTVYNAPKEMDFSNVVCYFEDLGVNVMAIIAGEGVQNLSLCRAVIAFVTGKSKTEAGKMLTRHMINGGTIEPFINFFNDLMEEAGFGKAEEAQTEAETPQTKESTPEE